MFGLLYGQRKASRFQAIRTRLQEYQNLRRVEEYERHHQNTLYSLSKVYPSMDPLTRVHLAAVYADWKVLHIEPKPEDKEDARVFLGIR